jgi:hypothetical protein
LSAVICEDDEALSQLYREIAVNKDSFISFAELQVFVEELTEGGSLENRYIFYSPATLTDNCSRSPIVQKIGKIVRKESIDVLDISQFANHLFRQRDADEVLSESVFKQELKEYFSKGKGQCWILKCTETLQVRQAPVLLLLNWTVV